MPDTYTTQDGDMVDLIAFVKFGRKVGVIEKILLANPGLAARGPVLPAGITITLPDPEPEPAPVVTRLWGLAS